MTNVVHHAYPDGADYLYPTIENQWWMSGSVNHNKDCLTAIFFDQGVGIPATLPATYAIEKISEFLANLGLMDTDAARIKAAINLGRTSTDRPNRGRGLLNIRQFIAQSERGKLRILSGKGEYIFNSDGTEELKTHKQSIGGTLIQWLVYV